MPRQSVLTEEQKNSISIESFIFHIIVPTIKGEEREPKYLSEVILTQDQQLFFRDRLIQASSGTQYIIFNKEESEVVRWCNQMIQNENNGFVQASRRMAYSFQSHHSGNTSDGVFIISTVKVQNNIDLVFLIKMDHLKVLSYNLDESGTKAIMQDIQNSFVEDKKALQKVAIVDIGNNFLWDVLAYDKTESDYFKRFLGIAERENNAALTRKTVSSVFVWAKQNQSVLPEDYSTYKSRAIQYLEAFETFDTERFINHVIRADGEIGDELSSSLKSSLENDGIAGQTFHPRPNSIQNKVRKNTLLTDEGVKIEWSGSATANGIIRGTEPDHEGLYQIIIKTRRIDIIN